VSLITRLLLTVAMGLPAAAQTTQTIPVPILKDDQVELDSQPSRAFDTSVRSLLNQEDFDRLEQIATEARTTKARFTGGDWKLRHFYSVTEDPGSKSAPDITWMNHIERLKRWAAAKPQSVTPLVALGSAYLWFGWKARGQGLAKTVPADSWKLFFERAQQAREVLEQAEGLPTKDPQLYSSLQWVAQAQNWSRSQVDVLLDQEMLTEPLYINFHLGRINLLMPNWGGKANEAEDFAQNLADRIGADEGNFLYFRIAAAMNCCYSRDQLALSWERVKLGFAALERLYGSTNDLRNRMAFMAVRQKDSAFAQQMFARIGNDWSSAVWGMKERFDSAKAEVAEKN
jgi:hypothetical protein